MKLFKKNKDNEINEAETAESGLTEDIGAGTETEESGEPKKANFRSLKFALICCAGALVVAAALLYATRFAAVDIIKGAAEVASIQNEETGSFIKYRAFYILDNYADEDSGKLYAVVPDVNQMVTINFSKRYEESVKALMEETEQQVLSGSYAQDKYVIAQGTVAELSEEQSTEMYEWFTENKESLIANHVISDAYDAADYLSDKVLLVDTVGGMNQTLVLVLSGLAVLLVLYVIAELVLMALGFYKEPKPEQDETSAGESAEGASPEESTQSAPASEEPTAAKTDTAETEAATESAPEAEKKEETGGEDKQ